MSKPSESPSAENSVETVPSVRPRRLGCTLVSLVIFELLTAMLLTPGDGGRWVAHAAAAIGLVNAIFYLVWYIPRRMSVGRDPGTTIGAILLYVGLAIAAVIGMSYILDSGLLP